MCLLFIIWEKGEMVRTMENDKKKYAGGVWPVMLTPFDADNNIDEHALEQLTEWYIANGVNGLFAACQSSEIFYLSLEERLKIVEVTVKAAKGRVPVIASANTSDCLEDQAKELNAVWKLGADAVILLSNRLAGPEEDSSVWIENLHRLMDMLDPEMRLGMYECPYPYKRVLSEEELQAMIDSERFFFIKDTCCDIEIIRRKLRQIEGSCVQLFNANTTTLLDSLRDGADGYCGVMANFHPELYVWLCEHYKEAAADDVSDILSLNSLIERQCYPVSAKWHLQNIEGLPLEIYARTQDAALLTETYKNEIRTMNKLSNAAFEKYCKE